MQCTKLIPVQIECLKKYIGKTSKSYYRTTPCDSTKYRWFLAGKYYPKHQRPGNSYCIYCSSSQGFPAGSDGKESACSAGDLGSITRLGRSSEEGHGIPVFLPGESPWTEEPGGLLSMGTQRVRHNWVTKHPQYIGKEANPPDSFYKESISTYDIHIW